MLGRGQRMLWRHCLFALALVGCSRAARPERCSTPTHLQPDNKAPSDKAPSPSARAPRPSAKVALLQEEKFFYADDTAFSNFCKAICHSSETCQQILGEDANKALLEEARDYDDNTMANTLCNGIKEGSGGQEFDAVWVLETLFPDTLQEIYGEDGDFLTILETKLSGMGAEDRVKFALGVVHASVSSINLNCNDDVAEEGPIDCGAFLKERLAST